MKNCFEKGFWVWSTDFNHLLKEYSIICGTNLTEKEYSQILEKIENTNDELNHWIDYSIKGIFELKMRLAYDGEEKSDMIHLRIQGPIEIKEKIEVIRY